MEEGNTILRAYKYRLYPNKEQEVLLKKHFGACRFLYNLFLQQRFHLYEEWGESLSGYTQSKQLPGFKRNEYPWLKEINSTALVAVCQNVDDAFKRFYRKKAGKPKFKSKHHRRGSFTDYYSIRVEDGRLSLNKFRAGGGLKMVYHRPIPEKGEIRQVTISETPTGKYYASVLVKEPRLPELPKTGKAIGLDVGVRHYAISSEGIKWPNPKPLIQALKKLKTAQKHLSRKQKGSARYERQRLKVARIHEKVVNIRLAFQHSLTNELLREYDELHIETLGIQAMLMEKGKYRKLNIYIADAAWYRFSTMLEYKAAWRGKKVIRHDRYFPSTKKCSSCGHVNEWVTLEHVNWTCEHCGAEHDIDENAGINLLQDRIKTE